MSVSGQAKIDARIKLLQNPNHPEVLSLVQELTEEIDKEVGTKIINLEMEKASIGIDNEWFETLQDAFLKYARFGEGGYMDNKAGRAAFVRTVKALEIDESKLDIRHEEAVEIVDLPKGGAVEVEAVEVK
jgi:hypothetical protein